MNVVGLALYDSGGNLVSSDLSADGLAYVSALVGPGELFYIFITTNPDTAVDSGYTMYVAL